MKPVRLLPTMLALLLSTVCVAQSEETPSWLRTQAPSPVPLATEQGRQPWKEYDKQIQTREVVGALGPDLFGDQVNMQNGALSFSVTDVSIPGNSKLPVAFSRMLTVSDRDGYIKNDLPLGDWDLDLPRILGTYAPMWAGNRCSGTAGPASVSVGLTNYQPSDFWQGLQASMPGGGELMVADQGAPAPTHLEYETPGPPGDTTQGTGGWGGGQVEVPALGNPWLWMTAGMTYFQCIPASNDNTPGSEGFLAITTDGTQYWFDHLAQFYAPPLLSPAQLPPAGSPVMPVSRRLNVLYPTRVRDRFGNEVVYSYDNNPFSPVRLTSIVSNDERGTGSAQRRIEIEYRPITVTANNLIWKVTITNTGTPPRVWEYRYENETTSKPTLHEVILPDGSKWTLGTQAFSNATITYDSTPEANNCDRGPGVLSGPGINVSVIGTMTHPSGATGEFEVKPQRHGRSNVPKLCTNLTFTGNNRFDDIAVFPKTSTSYSLVRKSIAGPALVPMTWTYSYGEGLGSWDQAPLPGITDSDICNHPARQGAPRNCAISLCNADSCAGPGAMTTVTGPGTGPNTEWQRYTFGNSFRYNEGKLLKVERGSINTDINNSPAQVVQTDTTTYELATSLQTFKTPIARSLRARGDGYTSEQIRPEKTRVTTLNGASFSWWAQSFDAYARPLQVMRYSNLGGSRTDLTTYRDNTNRWVIGQVGLVENMNTVPRREVSKTEFNASTDLPTKHFSFGVSQGTLGYDQYGMLSSYHDPNLNMTVLSSWKRGVPRLIQYPGTTSHPAANQSAVVNDFGDIREVVDQLGSRRTYDYDAMGRLQSLTHPDNDGQVWNPTSIVFTQSTGQAMGITGGHWQRVETRGSYQKVTYFDALWRPSIEKVSDPSSQTTIDATQRFRGWQYNHRSQPVFESYPFETANSIASLPTGIRTLYDSIGRPTAVRQDSELGVLETRTLYTGHLSPGTFQTSVINPRGFETVSRFIGWDTPASVQPKVIAAPEGVTTTTTFDTVFGKPLSVARLGVTRSFVYDVAERLCKRIDPEHGVSVTEYDPAGNVAWSANGLPANATFGSITNCNRDVVPPGNQVTRSYDALNRLDFVAYPDSTDDVDFQYYPDGALHRAIVGSGASAITREYTYNLRRLPTRERLTLDNRTFDLGYRYNANGDTSELGYPDNVWEALNPDALGRPTTMGQYASSITWHRFGPLKTVIHTNGITFTQGLNTRGLPEVRSDSKYVYPTSTYLLLDTYTWDANGNLEGAVDAVGNKDLFRNTTRTLTYDGRDRLIIAASEEQPSLRLGEPAPWGFGWGVATFTYDALDNVRTFDIGALNLTYTYNGANQLDKIFQAGDSTPWFSYVHNPRGQTTTRQSSSGDISLKSTFSLNWDSADRLTSTTRVPTMESPSPYSESYRYDAHGHRARTTRNGETIWQVYSQSGDLRYETTSTGNTRKYARVGGRLIGEVVNASRHAIHTDIVGSVRLKTDWAGIGVDEDVRAPFGSILVGGLYRNGPAFTGHMEDGGTGLTYMKARYYDPVALRFLSPDPVYVDLNSGGNFNRYWYANSNPYTLVDPDGRAACPTGTRICYQSVKSEWGKTQQAGPSERTQMKDSQASRAYRSGQLSDGTRLNINDKTTDEQGIRIGSDGTSSNPFQKICWSCSNGDSGTGGRYNIGGLSGDDSPGHTHPAKISEIPGRGDAGLTTVTGQTNYVLSRAGVFAIERTDVGYRVRQIEGNRLRGSAYRDMIKQIGAWNQSDGASNSGDVSCSSRGC